MMQAGAIEEWESPTRDVFRDEIHPTGQPAILRRLVNHWPVIQQESDDAWRSYLSELSQEKPVQCFTGDRAMGGFFTFTEDLRQFNFDRRKKTLRQILQLLTDEPVPGQEYLYAGAVNVPEHLPDFAHEHSNPFQVTEKQLTSIWIGNRTRIPAHWDLPSNIACVARGRRRFTLFPITQVPNLYIGPLDITIAGQPSSLVDPRSPDRERFPLFEHAEKSALVAELEPGDAIYIPSLWLHHVESLSDIGMLVNFWWRDGVGEQQFSPMLSLMHALLSIPELPDHERESWKALFEYFVFRTSGSPLDHLPPDRQGVQGSLTVQQRENLKRYLASFL